MPHFYGLGIVGARNKIIKVLSHASEKLKFML